jgi:hypothetical protein
MLSLGLDHKLPKDIFPSILSLISQNWSWVTVLLCTVPKCHFALPQYIKLHIYKQLTFRQIDIPTHMEDSFYRGDVYVGFKNAVTQPSSALRHATELKEILESRNGNCMSSCYIVFTEDIG